MTHKIAIITSHTDYVDYTDSYSKDETIVNSITEWTEVSHDDFELLQKSSNLNRDFFIIEQPTDTKAFVANTVAGYIEYIKAENARALIEKKRREDLAIAKKLKKLATEKESKLKLLRKLQEELGDSI